MSRFSESDSRWDRIRARNEGRLVSGIAREALGKLYLRPWARGLLRPFAPRREPEKWLFVVGCYNSGTTILRRLLESHPDIAALVREGAKLTSAFPDLEVGGWPRMMYRNRALWDLPEAGAAERARMAQRDWAIWWRKGAKVFFEKSIDHSTRMGWLDRHFANAHFIAITRNGFCVNEGIMRRAKPSGAALAEVGERYPPELVAEQWTEFDRVVQGGCASVKKATTLRYEDLMADPVGEMTRLFAFLGLSLPEMHRDGAMVSIAGEAHELIDQNASSLARLSADDIARMTPIMRDAMQRHGYATP